MYLFYHCFNIMFISLWKISTLAGKSADTSKSKEILRPTFVFSKISYFSVLLCQIRSFNWNLSRFLKNTKTIVLLHGFDLNPKKKEILDKRAINTSNKHKFVKTNIIWENVALFLKKTLPKKWKNNVWRNNLEKDSLASICKTSRNREKMR